MLTTNLIEYLKEVQSTLTRFTYYGILGIAKLLNEKTIELGLTALPGLSIHPNCLFVQKLGSFEKQLGCLIPQKERIGRRCELHTDTNHSQADGGLNVWLPYIVSFLAYSGKRPTPKLRQPNTARFYSTPTASLLASSRCFEMEIYRFRVYRGWYAYVFLKDAQTARQQFLDNGHPPDAVSEVEKSEDGQDFEFKMNPVPFRFNGSD